VDLEALLKVLKDAIKQELNIVKDELKGEIKCVKTKLKESVEQIKESVEQIKERVTKLEFGLPIGSSSKFFFLFIFFINFFY
jgi:archaellum component FlaC